MNAIQLIFINQSKSTDKSRLARLVSEIFSEKFACDRVQDKLFISDQGRERELQIKLRRALYSVAKMPRGQRLQ